MEVLQYEEYMELFILCWLSSFCCTGMYGSLQYVRRDMGVFRLDTAVFGHLLADLCDRDSGSCDCSEETKKINKGGDKWNTWEQRLLLWPAI